MEAPRTASLSNRLDLLLKNRKRVRMAFFMSDFPHFFGVLLVSYCGIFFTTYAILSSSNTSTSFIIARFWLQRFLGVVNLSAFISFWVQAHGLVGENGIKPIKERLEEVERMNSCGKLSVSKYEYHPTLFWISASDKFIHFVCFLGVLSSILIISPCFISTTPLFILCAICYGSIKTMGAEFMQLQWDSMLVEINVICLWLELDSLISLRTGANIWVSDSYSSRIGIIMLYWLHYRLMMSAGFVKLSSGCPKWRDGTAMQFHFWTQPIPSPTSFLAWKCGLGTSISTYGAIFSEIILPLTIFFVPYPICRVIACINTIGLMFLIFATGNFGFFNLLTATLGISCIDDNLFARMTFMDPIHFFLGFKQHNNGEYESNETVFHHDMISVFTSTISVLWFIMILIVSIRSLWHMSYRKLPITGSFKLFILKMSMWSIVNAYGLFARMTTFRHELIFEGTICDNYDDEDCEWKTYEFKYKPGDINRTPPFALCHLPRLDWRLWFLPLRKYNQYNDGWIIKFVKKLIKNEKHCPTLKLLACNPFKNQQGIPIKAIRVLQYEYRFVGDFVDDEFGAAGLNWEIGKWWIRRSLKCKYIPIITKEDVFNNNQLKQFELTQFVQRIKSIVQKKKRRIKQNKSNGNEQQVIEEQKINNDGNVSNEYHQLNDKETNEKEQKQNGNKNSNKNIKKVKKPQMESLLNSTIKSDD